MSIELNRIYNEDCLDGMARIPDGFVDLVVTDPPYTTPTITAFGREKVRNIADLSIQESYVKSLKREFSRILKPDGAVFMFCDDTYYPSIFRAFYDWNSTQMIVWDKGRIGMGRPFRKRHELIFYANRASLEYNRTEGITHYPTVMNYKPVLNEEKVHGAQKPLELISDIIKGFSNEGDIVLDCFMGSGTTALAAITNGRKSIGFELNGDYLDTATKRLDSLEVGE